MQQVGRVFIDEVLPCGSYGQKIIMMAVSFASLSCPSGIARTRLPITGSHSGMLVLTLGYTNVARIDVAPIMMVRHTRPKCRFRLHIRMETTFSFSRGMVAPLATCTASATIGAVRMLKSVVVRWPEPTSQGSSREKVWGVSRRALPRWEDLVSVLGSHALSTMSASEFQVSSPTAVNDENPRVVTAYWCCGRLC